MRVLVSLILLSVAIAAEAQQPGIDEPVTARGCLSRAGASDCRTGNCGLVLRTNEKLDQAPGAPLSVSSTRFELLGDNDLLFDLEEHVGHEMDITMWLAWEGNQQPIVERTAPTGRFPGPPTAPTGLPRSPFDDISRQRGPTSSASSSLRAALVTDYEHVSLQCRSRRE
jgi:hypothetical protein